MILNAHVTVKRDLAVSGPDVPTRREAGSSGTSGEGDRPEICPTDRVSPPSMLPIPRVLKPLTVGQKINCLPLVPVLVHIP